MTTTLKSLFIALFIFSAGLVNAQSETEYKTLIEKYLVINGTEENVQIMISQLVKQYKALSSDIPEEVWDVVEEKFLKTSISDLVEIYYPIYKKHFSYDEFKQVVDFFETPIGAKFGSKQPVILQESMQAGQKWGEKLGLELQQELMKVGDDYKNK